MPRVLRNFLIVLAVIVLVSLLLLSFFAGYVTFVEDVLGRRSREWAGSFQA